MLPIGLCAHIHTFGIQNFPPFQFLMNHNRGKCEDSSIFFQLSYIREKVKYELRVCEPASVQVDRMYSASHMQDMSQRL